MRFPYLLSILFLLVAAWPDAVAAQQSQHNLYTFDGAAAGDRFGWSVSGAGDVNRDGYADVIVGDFPRVNNVPGSARVMSGRDGRVLHSFSGLANNDQFGFSVSAAGDVDRDSFPDVIVGARNGGKNGGGYAQVFSGLTGKLIWTFHGGSSGDWFGFSVDGAGDMDRDGYADLIVGAKTANAPGPLINSGRAYVFSGKTRALLGTLNGLAAGDNFGQSVAGVGDVNKDGWPDVAVGAGLASPAGRTKAGTVTIFSGRNLAVILRTHLGPTAGGSLGCSVAAAGDVNADGYADYIAGQYLANTAYVFSGQNGATLHTWKGVAANDWFGVRVGGGGDVDKDGTPDLIVGARLNDTKGTNSGMARVFSGKTGQPIFTWYGSPAGVQFGSNVAVAGDVNRDGHADLVVGSWTASRTGQYSGSAHVLSGKKLTLATDTHMVSVTGPTYTQNLALDAGKAHANRSYWVLGSLGTRPGINLLGLYFPLNPDPYTNVTIGLPATGPIWTGFKGTLNINGQATASFKAPARSKPLGRPITLYHAYLVYDTRGWHMVSNATPLTVR